MKSAARRRSTARGSSFLHNVPGRFVSENMMQTSAALAFTTLLGLVPLVALLVTLTRWLPFLDPVMLRLEGLIEDGMLPAGTASTIAGSISRFSSKAQRLTGPGLALLAVSAFMLMHTIERALNHVWQVQPRPWLRRIRLYGVMMTLWPLVMGGLAFVISFAVTTSLGFVEEPRWLRQFLLKGVTVMLLGLFLAFLYYAVPNAKVSRRGAVLAGFGAALAFLGMQRVFEMFLVQSVVIKSVYGAFAALPVFLVWLHFSWAIVLAGGLVAANLTRPSRN